MTNGLKIPTKELVVEIAFLDGSREQMGLFLAEHDQQVLHLLEGRTVFLPAFATKDRSWSILNKHSILWLSIALIDGGLPIEEGEQDTILYERRVQVAVQFAQADAVRGEILFSPPTGKGRLTDYLNRETRFFHVWTSDALFFINKEHVLRLVEQTREGI